MGYLRSAATAAGLLLVASLIWQTDAALWGRSAAELEERLTLLCHKLAAAGPLPNSAYRKACDGFLPEARHAKEMSWFMTVLMYGGTALLIAMASMFLHVIQPTRGLVLKNHVVFIIAMAALLFTPIAYQETIFSPTGVSVVGVLYPTLESVRAVLSDGGADDTRWLQYWIAQGTFTMGTAWLDTLAAWHPSLFEWWWYVSFVLFLWLQLPFTDGSCLIYNIITKPFIVPLIQPVAEKISDNSFITGFLSWCINGAHLIILYIVFILLPGHVGQFVCIMLATCYPLVASIVAVTTDDTADDTQWLTYWSVFSIIHLAIHIVQDIAIWIPGFYSVMTLTVAFLLLPVTRGAETIFRKLLVPVCQLEQQMLQADADRLRKEMEKRGLGHLFITQKDEPNTDAPETVPADEPVKDSKEKKAE